METKVIPTPAAIPFYEEEYFMFENEISFHEEYYIYAISINGGRFISENFIIEDMNKYIEDYSNILKYFGGGILTVYTVDVFNTVVDIIWI